MEKEKTIKLPFLGLCILLGFFSLGGFTYLGIKTISDKDRVVSVKGLAEMNMTAIKSTIDITFSEGSDDLSSLLKEIDNRKTSIISYLKTVYTGHISEIALDVKDKQKYYEYQWRGGNEVEVKIDRYTVSQSLRISFNDKVAIEKTENFASTVKADLIKKGLTSEIKTNYTFPELNSIKPQLIAESTKNARIAGDQFANDSNSKLGKIKTATQGQITLVSKRRYSWEEEEPDVPQQPYIQKARVVSSIVFFLE
ncbi:MAG: SIMPL domain-containing protein [Candidatus Cloacimonetes bacterium]|nr:SIMPL domain-containing protein [Candidatus Cloacimonadota bacterium]